MKKTFVIISFVAALCGAVQAQDTLLMDSPKDSYYYTSWAEGEYFILGGNSIHGNHFDQEAVAYYSKPMEVYGLAISPHVTDRWRFFPDRVCVDTTMDSMIIFVRIYVPEGDSLRVVGERPLHLRDTPVSYYLAINKKSARYYGYDILVDTIPVYELFFDQPITVSDTFYVGYYIDRDKQYIDTTTPPYNVTYKSRFGVVINGYKGTGNSTPSEPYSTALHCVPENPYHPNTWIFRTTAVASSYLFMYAIIQPQDSTGVGDTTGIGRVDLASRYVSVQPNPATDEVRVMSSFGMRHIEAFDGGGRRILDRKAEGLQCTLDVSAWPRGAYLLRITTDMGVTTKKLIVR